jgi:hypothetical protein
MCICTSINDHPYGLVVRFCLQIQKPRAGFPALSEKKWVCPLGLVSTIEELLGRNISGFCLESRKYGLGVPVS